MKHLDDLKRGHPLQIPLSACPHTIAIARFRRAACLIPGRPGTSVLASRHSRQPAFCQGAKHA